MKIKDLKGILKFETVSIRSKFGKEFYSWNGETHMNNLRGDLYDVCGDHEVLSLSPNNAAGRTDKVIIVIGSII